MSETIKEVALHEQAQTRYLNYAMSVISSRALPDVRDGLKPVQRRILYAMYHNLGLKPEARFRKSAAVVGEVMAKYHPHGDSSIYEALVRMAQPFSLRRPLVDGQGNFGSLDGDGAAAMRYTECKLRPLAVELLAEIRQDTVDYEANYDGQHAEPQVLPVRFPQLLVNGSEGIAVGMATRIPPHNLGEVLNACIALIDDPGATVEDLCQHLLGPDFPTGGQILNTKEELLDIYKTGRGTVRTRGKWNFEKRGKTCQVVVTEIPYGVNKSSLVEKIGKIVAERKLPMAQDVRDESAEDVRIVIEVKKEAEAEPVMAYLFRHTPLESTFPVNLTCLFPTENPELPVLPRRSGVLEVLREWNKFRYRVVERRLQHVLRKLHERLHILEGFEKIFNDLDLALKIIRENSGKRVISDLLQEAFDLTPVQAGAILDIALYKISALEVKTILAELAQVRQEAEGIVATLSSSEALWALVREELLEVFQEHAEERRTEVGTPVEALETFSEADLIVNERAYLYVTREGWIKRMASYSGAQRARVREGDELGWVFKTTTPKTVSFFTDGGVAYTMRVVDAAPTSSYGEPIQKFFNFADGEKIVGVVVHDSKILPAEETGIVALTQQGRAIRSPLSNHSEPSTKNGRRFANLEKKVPDGVVAVWPSGDTEDVSLATRGGQALAFPVSSIPWARGSAKGVTGIKLNSGDEVFAFELASGRGQGVTVCTSGGREETITDSKWGGRRGRGKTVITRGSLVEWVRKVDENLGEKS